MIGQHHEMIRSESVLGLQNTGASACLRIGKYEATFP